MPPRTDSSPVAFDVDLLVRAGRVVCPATGRDAPGVVAIRGDRLVEIDDRTSVRARQEIELPDATLLPGLVDLHGHPARSGSIWGIDPDEHFLARGTTTVLSQGDAGARNCAAYIAETIQGSRTEVLLAINLAAEGESVAGGCLADLALADVPACIAACRDWAEHLWGIAVNASHNACGATDPQEVLRRALLVAEETGLPLLYGLRRPSDWSLADQLSRLRSGDIVTYCYRATPHNIVRDGQVLPEVWEARARGIGFDLGHGCGSFSFEVAAAAIAAGFPPDTLSTDLQRGHLGQQPRHDLPLVMSKLRAVGLSEPEIFAAVTSRPAAALRRLPEIGTLQAGTRADLVALQWRESEEPLVDVHGVTRAGGRWETILVVAAGQLVFCRVAP